MLTGSTTRMLDGITPATIETPSDYAAVARLLKGAADQPCAVVPLGGGTMLDLGAPLERADVAVSLEKLDHVLNHEAANLTVRTEAGITLEALGAALGQHGQFLPLDPPFPARATIGGVLAANASGPLRHRFGSARDLLLGVRVALPNGDVVRGGADVVKNVAGYDLPKLFVGSLGTLGIIVEATFKIVPLPARTATLVVTFQALPAAAPLASRLLRSPLLPVAVELLNAAASARLGLHDGPALVVRFGGLASAVKQQLAQMQQWAREQGAAKIETIEEDGELWAGLRDFIFEKPTVCKLGVRPAEVAETGAMVEQAAAARGLRCTIRAHALGVIYAALEGEPEPTAAMVQALRESVRARRGYLVIQRGSRELRARVDPWGPVGSDFEMMRRLKQELDPNRILNPGRFFGGL